MLPIAERRLSASAGYTLIAGFAAAGACTAIANSYETRTSSSEVVPLFYRKEKLWPGNLSVLRLQ